MWRVRSAAVAMKISGRGDDLGAGGVVLADPRLVVAEPVEVHDQVEVALERQRRVLARRVERGHEDPEAKTITSSVVPFLDVLRRGCRAAVVIRRRCGLHLADQVVGQDLVVIMRRDEPSATRRQRSKVERIANDLRGGNQRGDLLFAMLARRRADDTTSSCGEIGEHVALVGRRNGHLQQTRSAPAPRRRRDRALL